jgi:hypothetical protein
MNCAGGIQAGAEVPENNDRKCQEFRHSGETSEYQEIWQDEEHSIRRNKRYCHEVSGGTADLIHSESLNHINVQ